MPPKKAMPNDAKDEQAQAHPTQGHAIKSRPGGGHSAKHMVRYGNIELNILAGQARADGKDLLLAPKEFALLYLLLQHLGKVVPQSELYEAVWDQPLTANNLALKSSMSRLRRKLADHGYRIVPQRSIGYRLEWVNEAPADEG